jgi:hypothetical protein
VELHLDGEGVALARARRIDEANDPLLADLLRPPVAAGVGVG